MRLWGERIASFFFEGALLPSMGAVRAEPHSRTIHIAAKQSQEEEDQHTPINIRIINKGLTFMSQNFSPSIRKLNRSNFESFDVTKRPLSSRIRRKYCAEGSTVAGRRALSLLPLQLEEKIIGPRDGGVFPAGTPRATHSEGFIVQYSWYQNQMAHGEQ